MPREISRETSRLQPDFTAASRGEASCFLYQAFTSGTSCASLQFERVVSHLWLALGSACSCFGEHNSCKLAGLRASRVISVFLDLLGGGVMCSTEGELHGHAV
eukprot:3162032-Amphidinium_carterae.1